MKEQLYTCTSGCDRTRTIRKIWDDYDFPVTAGPCICKRHALFTKAESNNTIPAAWDYKGEPMDIESIAGPDAPVVFNAKGGGQSHLPARFDLVDGKAMFAMAQVLDEGAKKYGANNWRMIEVEDHLNHLIMHAYAYLSGDRSDGHLSHIMCRAMFAQAVDIDNQKIGF